MSEPRKTKVINGVEYGYCGNHYTGERAEPARLFNQSREEAKRNEDEWLANAVLLGPEATDSCSAEELAAMSMKSVWKPMSSLPNEVS